MKVDAGSLHLPARHALSHKLVQKIQLGLGACFLPTSTDPGKHGMPSCMRLASVRPAPITVCVLIAHLTVCVLLCLLCSAVAKHGFTLLLTVLGNTIVEDCARPFCGCGAARGTD